MQTVRNRLFCICFVRVRTTSLFNSRYKKCYLSIDRKKKKEDLYRGHTRSHVCTNVHHITYVIIASLCSATQYQISMKQNALIVLVYICIYTYIYYTAIENTRGFVLANSNFATKTKRALPVLRFFAHELLPNYLLEFPPMFRYFIGEKKKEREIKKECYNEEC